MKNLKEKLIVETVDKLYWKFDTSISGSVHCDVRDEVLQEVNMRVYWDVHRYIEDEMDETIELIINEDIEK